MLLLQLEIALELIIFNDLGEVRFIKKLNGIRVTLKEITRCTVKTVEP